MHKTVDQILERSHLQLFANLILMPGLSNKPEFSFCNCQYFPCFFRFGGGDPGVLKAMVAGGHLGMMAVGWIQ